MIARRLLANDRGATAIEYALLAGLIATVIIFAITSVGRTLDGLFTGANTRLTEEMQEPTTE